MSIKAKIYVLSAALFLGVFLVYPVATATDNTTRLRIDSATIEKGYTVAHNNDNFRFAVTPGQVDQEVNVVIKDQDLTRTPLPANKQLASPVYSFDMIGQEYNPIITTRPSWVAIHFTTSTDTEKAIYNWDSNKRAWVEMPSRMDTNEYYIQGITHLPFSKVAVLEKSQPKQGYTGIASWYETGAPMTAAMNHFELGDMVKVTNTDNDQSCLVEIIDRGPTVPGRVIDLSDDAFEELAPLSRGIIDVMVERY